MLSALAKYIFGGVMGDAPETTTMQYETREINDWLLVDMPDQDIDNEDMDSESDDDDILTAIPLLLAEEVSMSPRKIVLSYEPDSACDKSYAKIRKCFHDKTHSASSKVQVHASDKIQGNFVANVEAISLETDNISTDKLQRNLSKVPENVKSKQSKSKISKPKKSKKNKIHKKCIDKIQDTSDIIENKCNNDVLEKLNEDIQEIKNNKVLNLREEMSVHNEILDNLGLAEKIEEDSPVAVIDNSNHKNIDKVEDSQSEVVNSFSLKNSNEVETDSHITIINDSIQKNTNNIKDKSGHKNHNVTNKVPESCTSKTERNRINEVPKNSCKLIKPDPVVIENNLPNISKRSYADVVKANSDLDKYCNKEVLVDKISKTEPDSLECVSNDKVQDNQQKLNDSNKRSQSKKNKAKKLKNKMQNGADFNSQNIPASNSMSYQVEAQRNVGDKKDLSDKFAIIPSPDQDISKDETKGNVINTFDRDTGKSIAKIQDIAHENAAEMAQEIHTDKVLINTDDKSKSNISEMQQKIFHDNLGDNKEEILVHATEQFESNSLDVSNAKQTEDTLIKNVNYNKVNLQNKEIQEDFNDDIYFDLFCNSDNENTTNFRDNCQNISKNINDNYQENAQDSFEFQQNLDDTVLENIADLWDIYAKIQDNSDDDINEMSDDEMNEDFNESLQDSSDREMIENSEEQITDDEMNENSEDDYEEITDDEIHRRPCGKILQNLFGEEKTKIYNRVFGYNLEEESEESDYEPIISRFILAPRNNSMEGKQELMQPFKCNFLEELKQNASEIPKHHSSCVPLAEYELVEYFNSEPQYFYACQSLQYPSSYALAIAEYYSNHDQYFSKYPEGYNTFIQKYKRRAEVDNQTPPAPSEPRYITNTTEILEKIINRKCSVLPTKTAVVLEHVKDLKPIQQAMQYEARKYLTRSQLNRQNRNYIYQSSSKTNRRRNLQRNHSGVNNNRKCC